MRPDQSISLTFLTSTPFPAARLRRAARIEARKRELAVTISSASSSCEIARSTSAAPPIRSNNDRPILRLSKEFARFHRKLLGCNLFRLHDAYASNVHRQLL